MQLKNTPLTDYLAPAHVEDLKRSGLSDETILEAEIKGVSPSEIPGKLSKVTSAYKIPYLNKDGFFRLKLLMLVQGGNVCGISITVVTPPAAAALVPVWKSSQSDRPRSLK